MKLLSPDYLFYGPESQPRNYLDFLLVVIGAVLLGIWAVEHTIALRNFLLISGFILAIFFFQKNQNYLKNYLCAQVISMCLPFICLGLLYVWIFCIYFFITPFHDEMGHEIRSTWARSFLGMVLGIAIGRVVQKNNNLYGLIWLGILISFAVLFAQYIPRAFAAGMFFIPDRDGYIFYGKAALYLAGSVMIAGSSAGLIVKIFCSTKSEFNKSLALNILIWAVGIFLVLYSYAYIFDTRSGLALALLIFSSLAVIIFFALLKKNLNFSKVNWIIAALTLLTSTFFLSSFFIAQIKYNDGWETTVEDAYIGIQINKYPNWHSFNIYAYPKSDSGRTVKLNTYQRFAWGSAGIREIIQNPLGIGRLKDPLIGALKDRFPNLDWNGNGKSTLSGFIDIGISLGIPGLVLLIVPMLIIVVNGATQFLKKTSNRFGIASFALGITLLYAYSLGELGNSHSIEILIFIMSFSAALNMTGFKSRKNEFEEK